MKLDSDFDREMIELYERAASECGYRATRYLAMVHEFGGIAAAKRLLAAGQPASGLAVLWEKGRLDLSVEALVCRKPWCALFTPDEISEAKKRLSDLGYKV